MKPARSILLILGLLMCGVSNAQISGSDKANLSRVMQEEKLAHDFYSEMNKLYSIRVFENITSGEKMHMDHVLNVMNTYGIENPVDGDKSAAGVFADEKFTVMFGDMTSAGATSVEAALLEAAKFEDMDIAGLTELEKGTESACMKQMYGKLIKGSGNHLRAFVKNLNRRGIEYTPVYLSKDKYNEIMNSK
ncbi:MAG: DUF2202 domain-containing protein [Ignavibacteria bacterium]|nr:DUF2202 domain-containing protein [Ignavibacteria bacterium]